jgi:hypothetical protein
VALGGGAHPLDPSSLAQLGMDGRNVCVAYSGYVGSTRDASGQKLIHSLSAKGKKGKGLEFEGRQSRTEYLCGWSSFILSFLQSLVVSFGFSSIRGRSCRRSSRSFHHCHFLTPRVKSSAKMLATAKLNDENANTRNTRWSYEKVSSISIWVKHF